MSLASNVWGPCPYKKIRLSQVHYLTFLGKETIKIHDKIYNTLHFNFSSTDKKLVKDKKLNTDVWYDEKSLNWIKASFKKNGKWEYKLVFLN